MRRDRGGVCDSTDGSGRSDSATSEGSGGASVRHFRSTRSRRGGTWERSRWVVVAAVVGVVLVVLSLVAWQFLERSPADAAAAGTRATASSSSIGYSPDHVVSGPPDQGWRSSGETVGAWIELSWERPETVQRITITRNALAEPGVTDGYLSFGDGSFQQVRLSTSSPTTVITTTPRPATSLRFTATSVAEGATDVAVEKIGVDFGETAVGVVTDGRADGNEAPAGMVQTDQAASDPRSLVDGSGAAGPAGTGAAWVVPEPRPGMSFEMRWDRPRDLSSVELMGGAPGGSTISEAVVTFDDGSSMPVGAVDTDPEHPTTVSFMPRTTSSVRITVSDLSGSGPLSLGEVRAYRRGATPVLRSGAGPSGPGRSVSPVADVPAATCPPGPPLPTPGPPKAPLVVTCPASGSTAESVVALQVGVALGYQQITARVWPAELGAPGPGPVEAAVSPTGATTLPVDLSTVPPGPTTVAVEATGPDVPSATVYLQLLRSGRSTESPPPSAAAIGRTLVYGEEFDRPVSLTYDGRGADYAAAKPNSSGAEDFGAAIFPDPTLGFGTVGVLDGMLQIRTQPSPPGYEDPGGYGRRDIGGLLASARSGGSGFAAQYGYFEARMLTPAAPGTWPAFWMLPAGNLVRPLDPLAEIDVTEMYGHDPAGACHSTHEFRGDDDGGVAACGERFPSVRDALAWHTYGAAVLPTGITFYIDGQVVATAPQVAGGDLPMFFMLDLALDGGWPVDLTGVQGRTALYVDYVRVYV